MITGGGLLTPLGDGVSTTWRALMDGQYITGHTRLDGARLDAAGPPGRHAAVSRVQENRAEVNLDVDNHRLENHAAQRGARITCYARRAAEEALAEAGWSDRELSDDQTALVLGTSKGPAEAWIGPPLHMADAPCVAAGGLHLDGLAQTAHELSQSLGIAGPCWTLSAACASGLHALGHAAMLITSGQFRRVLVVAAEASVHPLFLASFRRLGVLADPRAGCRPFDRARSGFLMSEAAAAVCLEPAPDVQSESATSAPAGSGLTARLIVERFALAGDATHLTSSDPQARVLRHLIRQVAGGRRLDLIHAHGTGTVANDPVELAAISASIEPGDSVPVYSHKGALGHSQGAAGLIAVIVNRQAHRTGMVPPNVRSTQPLTYPRVRINPSAEARPIQRSLVIASGFGGAMSAVTLATQNP
jgi:3-oxoacyl-[acyl-carrier-protein] synthase II